MEGLAGPGTYGNVINRKYSKFPDRKKKIDQKSFFIMEKIDFEIFFEVDFWLPIIL